MNECVSERRNMYGGKRETVRYDVPIPRTSSVRCIHETNPRPYAVRAISFKPSECNSSNYFMSNLV